VRGADDASFSATEVTNMSSISRALALGGCIAIIAASAQARADVAAETPQSTSSAVSEQAPTSETNGIVQMFDEALQGVSLRQDQQEKLKELGANVDAKVGAVDQAKRKLLGAIGKEVGEGRVDADSLKPEVQAFVDASAQAAPVLRDAVQKMHDILDHGQRTQFADNLKKAMKGREGKLAPGAQLEEWNKKLNFTEDQKKKISDILEKEPAAGEAIHKRFEAIIAAFPDDSFSLDSVAPPRDAKERAKAVATHIIDVASKVTEILSPEQRAIVAKTLQERAGGTAQTSSDLEITGTVAQPIWMGRGFGYGGAAYRGAAYGVSRGYAAGYGGAFLF
jgi:hypothetical protein